MATRVRSEGWQLLQVTPPPANAPDSAIGEFAAVHPVGWMLKGLIGDRDGIPVVLSISLDPMAGKWGELMTGGPTAPDDVVTGQLLHSIPMGRLTGEVIALVAREQSDRARLLAKPSPAQAGDDSFLGMIARGHRAMIRDDLEALGNFPSTLPARGRRPISDEVYRNVAETLLRLQEENHRPGLMERLADRLGEGPETMRTRVKNAVKKGYLKSRGQGHRGYLRGPLLLPPELPEEKS